MTNDDKRVLLYFYREKGDVTRACSWPKIRAQLEAEAPHILRMMEEKERLEARIDAAIDTFCEEDE